MKYAEVFRAVTEGSPFPSAFPRRVHYAATMRRAKRWGRRYLRRHPYGAVTIYRKARRTA